MAPNNRLGVARVAAADIGAIPLGTQIFHIVGAAVTPITRQSGVIVMAVESGSFRIRGGDAAGTGFTVTAPDENDTTEGNGGLLITDEMGPMVFAAPSEINVVGSAAGAILTYWFL